MSIFKLWVNSFREDQVLICVEGEGETGLYKTYSRKLINNNYVNTSPVYHVWINGERECAIQDYSSAYNLFVSRKKENEQ